MMADGRSPKTVSLASGRLQRSGATGPNGDVLLTVTDQTMPAAVRFDSLIAAVVRRSPAFEALPVEQRVVACVMAFESIGTEDLRPMLNALGNPMVLPDGLYVSWAVGEQIRRCKLCVLTTSLLKEIDAKAINWELAINAFSRSCARLYSFPARTRIDKRLGEILADRLAWSYLHLPMPLVAHLCGITRMTLLPDSAWLRRFGIPVHWPELERSMDSDLDAVEETVIEAAYCGELQLGGGWFLEDLEKLCSGLTGAGVKKSDATAWRTLVSRLRALAEKLQMAGPVEALLLGWVLDIAAFGSARKKNPRVKTISNYVRAAARRLHAALRGTGKDPLSLDSESWDRLFKGLEDAGSTDANLRPALASFQRYLVRGIDAEPIPRLWRMKTAVSSPKANLVWAHEFEAVDAQVQHLTVDPRVCDQLAVWAALLHDTTLRFGELVGMQLRSIQTVDGKVQIEVAQHRGNRSPKSPAARRLLPISDEHALRLLLAWRDRRKLEGASGKDLLFGDPDDQGRVFKIGPCYRVFSAALKAVTGDPSVTVHSTRHGSLSIAVERAMLSVELSSQVNPLHQLAVLAGHKSETTTLTVYAHLIEVAVRHWSDLAIQKHLHRHVDAARWLNCSPDLLRQRRHRRGPESWSLWGEVVAGVGPNESPGIDAQAAPKAPAISTAPISGFSQFLRVAGDIAEGFSIDATAVRNSITTETVDVVLAALRSPCSTASNTSPRWGAANGSFSFARLSRPLWTTLVARLEAKSERAAVAALFSIMSPSGLDLTHAPRFLTDALEVMHASGFPADRFVIRYVRQAEASRRIPLAVAAAERRFEAAFGAAPQIECVKARRARPTVYALLLSSPATGERTVPSASSDLRTLRTVSKCAAAYDEFLRINDAPAAEESH